MNCKSESASHYAGCDCNEAHWQDQVARLTRERDEAIAGWQRSVRTSARAEAEAARLEAALRASVVAMKRWSAEEDGLPVAPIGAHEAVAAAEAIVGYVWAGWGPDPTRAALGEEGAREEREKEKGK